MNPKTNKSNAYEDKTPRSFNLNAQSPYKYGSKPISAGKGFQNGFLTMKGKL